MSKSKKQQLSQTATTISQAIRRERIILTAYTAVGLLFKGEKGGGRIITEPGQVVPMSKIAEKAARGLDIGDEIHPIYLEGQPYADFHMMDEVEKSEFLQQQHRDYTAAREKYEKEMTARKDAARKKQIDALIEQGVKDRLLQTTTPTPPKTE